MSKTVARQKLSFYFCCASAARAPRRARQATSDAARTALPTLVEVNHDDNAEREPLSPPSLEKSNGQMSGDVPAALAIVKNAGESVHYHDVCTIPYRILRAIIDHSTKSFTPFVYPMSDALPASARVFRTPRHHNPKKSIDDIRTKTDTKNESCLELLRLATLLKEVIPNLEQSRLLLNDSSANITSRKKAATEMNKFVIPLIKKATSLITSVASDTCPLPGMKEHFRKKHNDEKNRVSQTRLSKDITPEQYMISLFLSEETVESPRKPNPSRRSW